jgi:GntR family transcriptional regulator
LNHFPYPIQVDFRSDEPIYSQICEQIRQMVATGALKKGDQLPTVRQLATDLRINFNTVARAYRLLDESGLISTQHGRGTYIWELPDEKFNNKLRLENLEEITQKFISDAIRLNSTPDEIEASFNRNLSLWKENQQNE